MYMNMIYDLYKDLITKKTFLTNGDILLTVPHSDTAHSRRQGGALHLEVEGGGGVPAHDPLTPAEHLTMRRLKPCAPHFALH